MVSRWVHDLVASNLVSYHQQLASLGLLMHGGVLKRIWRSTLLESNPFQEYNWSKFDERNERDRLILVVEEGWGKGDDSLSSE